MSLTRHQLAVVSIAMCLFSCNLRGDYLRLKTGEELHGSILTSGKIENVVLKFRKLSGEEISVPADEIRLAVRRPVAIDEYADRVAHLSDTLEGHLQLAEWCRGRGLTKERDIHLQRVLDFDPQHEPTRKALGYVRHNGEWVTLDDLMASQGYVNYHGKYVFPQEVELAEHLEHLKSAHKDWHQKIAKWQRELTGPRPEAARSALLEIRDPRAVPGLILCFQNAPSIDQRKLLVQILAQIPSQESTAGLVQQSLLDSKTEIREQALSSILKEAVPDAIAWFVRALKHPSHTVVGRAAKSIQLLEGRQAVPDLIQALTTTHRVEEQRMVARRVAPGTASDPSQPLVWDNDGAIPAFPYLVGQNTNAIPPGDYVFINWDGYPRLAPVKRLQNVSVTVKKTLQNPEVLEALRSFTQQNFGYDKNAWRQWWRSQNPQSIITGTP